MNIKIAVQLYSVRNDCAHNLSETLKAIADMGYEGVEFAGYYGRTAEELRKLLERLNLKVVGSHIDIGSLMKDKIEKTIEFNKILGNKYLIIPWIPENMRNSKDAWLKTAHLFNEIAEKLKKEDMHIGYHNHTEEFKYFNGKRGFYIFADATNKDVILQIDVGNAMYGGVTMDEILEIIRKYSGRIKTIHLKEYSSKDPNALIGEGEVRWKELIELCEKSGGTEWYIIEQETYKYPPLDCIKRSLENLKKIIENI